MYTNVITKQFLLDKILSRICFFLNQTLNTYNMYVVDSEDFKDLVPNLFLLLTQSNLNYVRGEPCTYEFSIEKKFTLGNSS